jgi:DNA polymerase I-like protein with 3'-5' exonuclease and polymerase domains
LSTKEAAALIAAWERTYPAFANWKRETKARAERGEQLTTHGGRPLPMFAFGEARKAVAYVIQGSAADLFKCMTREVALQIRKRQSQAKLWLPLHDELVLSVPDDDTEVSLACAILTDCMTAEINGVTVSGKPESIGRSWRKL